jgi:hypothetical protein
MIRKKGRVCLVGASICLAAPAMGQVRTYTESLTFMDDLVGKTIEVEDYESAALGTVIPFGSEFNGLVYDFLVLPPAPGEIHEGGLLANTYNQIGLQGLYFERDGTPGIGALDFFYNPESVVVDFPEPVTAVGVFFNVGTDPALTDYCFIRTSTGEATTGGLFPDPTSPSALFFAGLISEQAFTSVEFGSTASAPTGWNADNLMFVVGEAACYADCDGNTVLDVFDFLCFQDAFVGGDPYADCDGNTVFDVFDFLCFQDAFVMGCP